MCIYISTSLLYISLNVFIQQEKLPLFLVISNNPQIVSDINLGSLILTFIVSLWQVFGGCIWQIPFILK